MDDVVKMLLAMQAQGTKPTWDQGSQMAGNEMNVMAGLRRDPRFAQDQHMQNILGPLQHQQRMREAAQDQMWALPSYALATPAYSGVKKAAEVLPSNPMIPGSGLGDLMRLLQNSVSDGGSKASQASLEEILRAYMGMGQGLMDVGSLQRRQGLDDIGGLAVMP